MMYAYLIPTVLNGKGKVTLEYQIELHKKDMRRRFCKNHEKHRISSFVFVEKLPSYKMMIRKDDRLTAPNGKVAYEFQKELMTTLNYTI